MKGHGEGCRCGKCRDRATLLGFELLDAFKRGQAKYPHIDELQSVEAVHRESKELGLEVDTYLSFARCGFDTSKRAKRIYEEARDTFVCALRVKVKR